MAADPRLLRFRRVYERHFRLIWAVVGQLGLQSAAREDAVQEIWITVYRRLDSLDPAASSRAWVCSIARKVVWRTRRNAQRFDRRVTAWADEPRAAPADAERRYEAATTVEAALASLTEPQRGVLVLSTVHGLTAPEISETLDVPLNTVYSRLRLARRSLGRFQRRAELESQLESQDSVGQEARGRMWVALLPQLVLPQPVAVAGTWATAKALATGMVLGGAVVAGLGVAVAEPPRSISARSGLTSVPSEIDRVSRAADPGPRPVVSTAAVPVLTPDSTRLDEQDSGADPPDSRTRRRRPRPKAPAGPVVSETPQAPKTPQTAPPETPAQSPTLLGPGLEAEADLLRRAQRALRNGKAQAGLSLLRRHQREFADGRLADVREGALVRALCSLDRTDEAAVVARRLRRSQPDSPVSTAVQDVCEPSR